MVGQAIAVWGQVNLLSAVPACLGELLPVHVDLPRSVQLGKESQEIMRARGVDEAIIHATASHGYGITVDIQPEHQMEKVLFATDELTGLIGAAAIMRPSKSVSDLEVKSVKKKFKDKKFAAGCSREVILQGAEMLGWDLDHLIDQTIQAMRASSHVD